MDKAENFKINEWVKLKLEKKGANLEQQIDFLGRDKKDYDHDLVQFKIPIERKRDFRLYCKQKGFPSMSACLNMVIVKLIEDERTLHDPRMLQPIDNDIKEIREFLPVMERYGMFKMYQK